MRLPILAAGLAAVTSPVAFATPGTLRTFGDWTVGCDNVRRCTAASLGEEYGTDWPAVSLAVSRGPGPNGRYELAFDAIEDQAPAPDRVTIDGRRFAAGLTGAPAAAIVAAMANGRTLTIQAGSRTLATLSLAGASAALRAIDAAQGRAGTITATVARGAAPASRVPAATPLPRIVAITPAGSAWAADAATIARLRRQAGCSTDGPARTMPPERHALGGGRTLMLLPCSTGAYNLLSALYVSQGRSWVPVQTDAPIGFDATGADKDGDVPEIVNGSWKDGALSGYAKGRGLGDCGVSQTLVWDGRRLRLAEQSEMRECRGNPNFITTWRARVVRG